MPMEGLYWIKVSDMPRTRSIHPEGRLETRAVLPRTGRQLNVDDFRRNWSAFKTEPERLVELTLLGSSCPDVSTKD